MGKLHLIVSSFVIYLQTLVENVFRYCIRLRCQQDKCICCQKTTFLSLGFYTMFITLQNRIFIFIRCNFLSKLLISIFQWPTSQFAYNSQSQFYSLSIVDSSLMGISNPPLLVSTVIIPQVGTSIKKDSLLQIILMARIIGVRDCL